jgi:hypothetical protein
MAKRRRPEQPQDPAPRESADDPQQLALPLDPEKEPTMATASLSQPARPALAQATAHPMAREPRPATGPHGHGAVRQCFGDLSAALEEGWEIVQPIFARPLWSVTDDSATAFNFVLRREAATRLVIVPSGRGVQRFIRDHHLRVDHRQ